MLKRVLMGVAGSPDFAAEIGYALDLAQRHAASIEALSIIDVGRLEAVGPVPIGAGPFAEHLVSHRLTQAHARSQEALEMLAREGAGRGLAVRMVEQEGSPLQVLSRAYRYADLLVLGLRGWFNEDVVEEPQTALRELLAAGVRPILGVSEKSGPVDRVMIAYNGSVESAKAMRQYVQFRLWGPTPVEIVCGGETATGEDPIALLKDAEAYVASHGLPVSTRYLDESTPAALLDHAAKIGADLIVMGTSWRRTLLMQHLGAHTLELFQTSTIPLFLTH